MTKKITSTYTPIVPAVEQAAKLLVCLGNNSEGKMTVTQICKKIEIHKSKGYSILHTLIQFDFITKDSGTKTYSLGPGLLSLAKNVQENLDIRKISEPFLQNLALQTKSTILLGVISNDQFFISATYEGDDTIGITIRANQSLHITHGAHGKAIAAFMDQKSRDNLLLQEQLYFYGKDKAFDMKALKEELKLCRKTGYAVDYGGVTQGINALSSPVFDHNQNIVAGIVLVGTFPKNKFSKYGKKVADISRKISRKAGANI
ncbi:MAG: IclR family transcriptional regulator [Desulfobacteraceae bacterium]|nr:IclR family transcriptional regulator [Desulfobacteraceae bacterium]